VSSDVQRSKREGFPFMECFNDAGIKFVQRYFKKNLVLSAGGSGHFAMTAEGGAQLVQAAKCVLNPDQADK
jgi:hypothetical protein